LSESLHVLTEKKKGVFLLRKEGGPFDFLSFRFESFLLGLWSLHNVFLKLGELSLAWERYQLSGDKIFG